MQITANLDPEPKASLQHELDTSPDSLDDIINRALRRYFEPSSAFLIPGQCAIAIPVYVVPGGFAHFTRQVCSAVYSYDNWMPCYPCQSDRATHEMNAAVKVAWKAIEWAIGQGVAA